VGGVLLALAKWLLGARLPAWLFLLTVGAATCVCLNLHCGKRAAESEWDSLRVETARLQRELGAASVTIGDLQMAVEEQNRWVERFRQETELQQERAEVAEARAQRVKVEWRERVVKVMQAQVPSDCEGAIRWGVEQAAAAAAEWRKGGVP
jgi:hypothetical protein